MWWRSGASWISGRRKGKDKQCPIYEGHVALLSSQDSLNSSFWWLCNRMAWLDIQSTKAHWGPETVLNSRATIVNKEKLWLMEVLFIDKRPIETMGAAVEDKGAIPLHSKQIPVKVRERTGDRYSRHMNNKRKDLEVEACFVHLREA